MSSVGPEDVVGIISTDGILGGDGSESRPSDQLLLDADGMLGGEGTDYRSSEGPEDVNSDNSVSEFERNLKVLLPDLHGLAASPAVGQPV